MCRDKLMYAAILIIVLKLENVSSKYTNFIHTTKIEQYLLQTFDEQYFQGKNYAI